LITSYDYLTVVGICAATFIDEIDVNHEPSFDEVCSIPDVAL